MATYSGYLTVTVPEKSTADQFILYSGLTSSGSFTSLATLSYEYPNTTVNYASFDPTVWYKGQYSSSTTGWTTPLSEPVSGSGILDSAPLVAITSSFDRAGFASSWDVYEETNLTVSGMPKSNVDRALATARAMIDIQLGGHTLNRYSDDYDTDISRRKFNASLQLIKEAEIALACSVLYKHMADDAIMAKVTGNTSTVRSVSVGQTALGGIEAPSDIESADYFDGLSIRYAQFATSLIQSVLPSTIPLRFGDKVAGKNNRSIWNFLNLK